MFNLECYINNAKYAFIDDFGYVYRKNDDSISYIYKPDSRECWLKIAYSLNELCKEKQEITDIIQYTIFFASFFDAKWSMLNIITALCPLEKCLKPIIQTVLLPNLLSSSLLAKVSENCHRLYGKSCSEVFRLECHVICFSCSHSELSF